MKKGPESMTLAEAQQIVLNGSDKGIRCLCCGRLSKVYKRCLHSGMAFWLIRFYKADLAESKWYHINELCKNKRGISPNDYSYLEFWGFLAHKRNEEQGQKDSGMWRITEKGKAFVRGAVAPKRIHLLNGELIRYSDEETTIKEALGKKFDYAELMRN